MAARTTQHGLDKVSLDPMKVPVKQLRDVLGIKDIN